MAATLESCHFFLVRPSFPSCRLGTRISQSFFRRIIPNSLLKLSLRRKKGRLLLARSGVYCYTAGVRTFSHRVIVARWLFPHFETSTSSDFYRTVTGRIAKQVRQTGTLRLNVGEPVETIAKRHSQRRPKAVRSPTRRLTVACHRGDFPGGCGRPANACFELAR
jgi:hypothetical protein